MKKFALLMTILGMVYLSGAHANTVESVFNDDSILTLDLRELVIATLEEKCPQSIVDFGLSETDSTVSEVSDNNQSTQTYKILLKSRTTVDGVHPKTSDIEINIDHVYTYATNTGVYKIKKINAENCQYPEHATK